MSSALSIQHIKKSFGDEIVLPDFCLDVASSEFCCLLGPSGCGKTTVLKIVAGLLQPDSGSVHLNKKDITAVPPQKRNVGMVFQNYALFPHLSVYDNIAYGLRRRNFKRNDIQSLVLESLELIGLKGFEERRIHELSGGQQQRVALSRVLVLAPQLLLFDEPLSNLDARLRMRMREEICGIQSKLRITTLFVTHDQEEAMSIADRITVMNHGRIVQEGTPREIYEKPISLFVADFIGKANILKARIEDNQLFIHHHRLPIPNHSIPIKNQLCCVIRPEQIQLSQTGKDGLLGRIEKEIFIGEQTKYLVRLLPEKTSSDILTVALPAQQAIYKAGDNVSIDLNLDAIHLFPAVDLKEDINPN